jgi:ribosomal protein S18 acetylase RimI-like enzyme
VEAELEIELDLEHLDAESLTKISPFCRSVEGSAHAQVKESAQQRDDRPGSARPMYAWRNYRMQPNIPTDLHICRFCEADQPENYVASVVPLVYEAAVDYFNLLFGSREDALEELTHWSKRLTSEYSILRAIGLMQDEDCWGIVIGLSGKDRNDCHKADILALAKSRTFGKRSLSHVGFEALRDSLPQVPVDVYYIRAISVASKWRGHGLGRRLMQIAIENGRAGGHTSFRVDVRADNTPARGLYEALGFVPIAQASNPITEWAMVAMQYNVHNNMERKLAAERDDLLDYRSGNGRFCC